MPILLVLFVTAACLPVPWPNPLGLDAAGAAGLTGAVVLASLAAAAGLRAWAVRALHREPERRAEVGRKYGRLRRTFGLMNLTLAATVVGLGWGWAVQQTLTVDRHGFDVLAPFAELVVPLPYFVVLLGGWFLYYDAERVLHAAAGGKTFPSRAGYALGHARLTGLMVGLPVGLYAGLQSLGRFYPEVAGADAFRLGSLALLPGLAAVMPLLAKPLLGLKRLPDGPTRDRLEALARRLRFRHTDLLLWPTHGTMANALIAGLVPQARYVVFTDRILDEFPTDEIDAIFGHEVGHQRHGHLWLYAAFILLSVIDLTALVLYAQPRLPRAWGAAAPDAPWWLALPPVGLAAAYIFLVFGLLSRRCERQADVFGCRAVSCANPACAGHDPDTDFPPAGRGLCPTGIRTFVRALERVELLHGPDDPAPHRPAARLLRGAFGWVRAWQHGPVRRRVGFLLDLIDHPAREPRFQRATLAFRVVLMTALVAALVALGGAVGWRNLLSAL